jgi:hypothetical protein
VQVSAPSPKHTWRRHKKDLETEKVRDDEGAIANAQHRDRSREKFELLGMPGLRHVLDARLAFVADQNERQSVLVWPTKLINSRTPAGFRHRAHVSRFLNRDRIVCDRIIAPDLSLWFRSHHMKCAVGIEGPDGAERVSPRAGERGWTRRSSRARTYQHDKNACENKSERIL